MAANLALSATRRLANRVSLCSQLSAARRSLRRSVLLSEFAAYLALSATLRFANRVSLSSELSAARRSLLLRSLASSLVSIHWGERERAPSCGLNGRAVTIYAYAHLYCACAALRANVAGRIGNGFSPAESSFLCPNPMMMMIWDYKREGDELFRRLQGS